jgi:hypothetical protein
MKHLHKLVILTSVLLLLLSVAWQNPQDRRDISAYVVKVVNDVKKKAPTTAFTAAVPLDRLRGGYQVKTEDQSLAIIKFQDDSKLIVRPKSIVDIKGEVQGKQILDRSVYTDRGNIAFNVKKSEKEQFRFSSPVSVASIRGTEGAYVVGENEDLLIILQGLADFLNRRSDRSTQVGGGQTGVANGNTGDINTRPSTPDEKNQGSTSSSSSSNQVGGGQQGGGQQGGGQKTKHQIRIPGQDKDGNPKTVIIEWEE